MVVFTRRDLFGAGAGLIGSYYGSESCTNRQNKLIAANNSPKPIHFPQKSACRGAKFTTFADFGGIGDGSTDNSVAWKNIADWALLRGHSGNTPKIRVPAGRYLSSEIPNFAINRLHIEFEGEVWLINTGTGNSFTLDGGEMGAGAYGLKITGWPQIYGTAGSSHGVFARGIFNSELEFNCRGAGALSAGFYGEWLVDNKIRFIMSSNEGGLYSKPTSGIYLTTRGVAEESSYNDIEAKLSGMDIGLILDAALGNNFKSGSIQNCRLGLETTRKAWDNKFWGVDFESNYSDFRDASQRLSFYGCDLNTGGTFMNGSSGARVFGGRMENVVISSGARNVLLSGMGYNRTGSGKLSNAGTQTRYRDVLNITEQVGHDGPN